MVYQTVGEYVLVGTSKPAEAEAVCTRSKLLSVWAEVLEEADAVFVHL